MDLPPLEINESLGLRTIPAGTGYSLCKSMLCRNCGHLFVDYRFSETEMSRLYGDYRGAPYTTLRESYEPGYEKRNQAINEGVHHLPEIERFLDDFVPNSDIRVLDWGGDTGINTPYGNRRSLLHIYDPSAKAAGLADAISFSQLPGQSAEYDLIVLSNVLEHIPFPADTLHAIRPFMMSDTILYIEVPFETLQQENPAPPYRGVEKKKHWHEHISFFSAESMERLIVGCGFTIESKQILDIGDSYKDYGSAVKLLQYACRVAPADQ